VPPRAVPDPNVLVAAAIAPSRTCGRLLDATLHDRWIMVVSDKLIQQLAEVLGRPKFRRWLTEDEAHVFVADIARRAEPFADPQPTPRVTRDPGDDYLVALSTAAHVNALISGDADLTELDLDPPIQTPAAFLAGLDKG
jgi:putative PIN family toxin of toxin-antitoxin system